MAKRDESHDQHVLHTHSRTPKRPAVPKTQGLNETQARWFARLTDEKGLSGIEALQVLAVCDRIRRRLPKVVSRVAKDRQRCYVAQRLYREFDRLGIGTVGVQS